MRNNFSADLKLIVVGNSGTGKTSFVNKWTKNVFSEKYKATIVSEFGYKILNFNGIVYRIQLWDLAGQDNNICITKIFCRDAHGALIMADCTDKNSLLETVKWKNSIDENTKFVDGSELPIILIENKIDLLSKENIDDSEEEIKEFSDKNNFLNVFRTSAKTGINVHKSMELLIQTIVKKLNLIGADYKIKKNLTLKSGENAKLNKKDSLKSNKKGCC